MVRLFGFFELIVDLILYIYSKYMVVYRIRDISLCLN